MIGSEYLLKAVWCKKRKYFTSSFRVQCFVLVCLLTSRKQCEHGETNGVRERAGKKERERERVMTETALLNQFSCCKKLCLYLFPSSLLHRSNHSACRKTDSTQKKTFCYHSVPLAMDLSFNIQYIYIKKKQGVAFIC